METKDKKAVSAFGTAVVNNKRIAELEAKLSYKTIELIPQLITALSIRDYKRAEEVSKKVYHNCIALAK